MTNSLLLKLICESYFSLQLSTIKVKKKKGIGMFVGEHLYSQENLFSSHVVFTYSFCAFV